MSPREAPTTTTWPELNLVDSAPRLGSSSSTPSSIRPAAAPSGAPSGMPIGTTRNSPVCFLPGEIQCPTFGAWKLVVRSAFTAAPSTSPLEALTPEAMSAATTGAPQPLIASIAAAAGSRGSPEKPVPKTASTTTPASDSAAESSPASTWRAPAGSRSRFAAASSESSAAGHSSRVSTSNPVWARARAATSPSPPLLPFPQTTAARFDSAASAAAAATASPAVSIRSRDGTPRSSIAQASTALMRSASRHGLSHGSMPPRLVRLRRAAGRAPPLRRSRASA